MYKPSALVSKIVVAMISFALPLLTHGQPSEMNYFARIAGALGSSRATNTLLALEDLNGSVVNKRIGRFGQEIWVLEGGNPNISECVFKRCVIVKNYVNLEKDDSSNYDLEVLTLPDFKVVKTQRVSGTFTRKNDLLGVSPKANISLNTLLTCNLSGGMGGLGCTYRQHPYFLLSNREKLSSPYSMNDLAFSDKSIATFSPNENFVATYHYVDVNKPIGTIKLQKVSRSPNKMTPVRLFPEAIFNGHRLACVHYPSDRLVFLLSEGGDVQIFQTNDGKRVYVGKIAKDFKWITSCQTSIIKGKLTLKTRTEGESHQYFDIKIF